MPGTVFKWAAPLFARFAERWSDDDAEAFARLLAPFMGAGGRLLDLGGGTGALAGLLARQLGCMVTVVDPSPQMLSYAHGMPGVEPVLADASALPFPDGNFDAVLVCDAFHHFADPQKAAREMARVARLGGGVLIAEPDSDRRAIRAIAVAERLLGEPAGFMRPEELELLMSGAGIQGRAQRQGKASYVFVGTVTQTR